MPRLIVILILLSAVTVWSQSPAFDVASVKRVAATNNFTQIGLQPGGRFIALNAPLRMLIRVAYELEEYQLLGGEDWIGRERFEVQATTGREIMPAEARAMLRSLLADRFKLVARQETRDLPIYELRVAREDGRLAEGLRPSGAECAPVMLPAGVPMPPPPPPGAASFTPLGVGVRLRCPSMFAPGWISARQVAMDIVVTRLATLTGRPVADRTRLAGVFDLDMSYAPNLGADGPSIFTALREQAGLALEPARGPVPVLVIDSAERPTEN